MSVIVFPTDASPDEATRAAIEKAGLVLVVTADPSNVRILTAVPNADLGILTDSALRTIADHPSDSVRMLFGKRVAEALLKADHSSKGAR